jgi:hypothetical protein
MSEVTNTALPGGLSEAEFVDASASAKQFGRDDMLIPFMRILQPLSPQINSVEGSKAGLFCNVATGALYDDLLVIPIAHEHNYTEWLPDRGGFVKTHGNDEQSWQALCNKENKTAFKPVTTEGNTIQRARHFFIFNIVDGDVEPCIFPFTGTMLVRAKTWSSKIAYAPKVRTSNGMLSPVCYYYTYKVTVEKITKGPYTWYLPIINLNMKDGKAVSTLDLPNGKAIWNAARSFEASFKAGEIKVAPSEEDGF